MSLQRILDLARRLPVTIALTIGVVVVFALEAQLGGVDSMQTLMRMGALNSGRLIDPGETWRLVTPMFLHYGWLHFGLNTLALIQLAALVELLFGSHRLMGFYLISGLVGNLASALFNPSYVIGQVGASGALFGLAGAVMGVALYGKEHWREQLARPLRALSLAVSFSISLLIAQMLFGLPMVIDHFAHAGGFLTGLLLAAAYPEPMVRTTSAEAALAYGSLGAILGAFLAMAMWGDDALESLPDDVQTAWEIRIGEADEGITKASLIAAMESVYADVGVPDPPAAFREELEGCAPETLMWLYQLTLVDDRENEALWTVERWAERLPDDPDALNALAWTLLTLSEEQARDPKRALVLITHGLDELEATTADDVDPPASILDQLQFWWGGGFEGQKSRARAAFLDTRAEALFQLGRLQEALADQREAVDLGEATSSGSLPEMKDRLQRIEAALGS